MTGRNGGGIFEKHGLRLEYEVASDVLARFGFESNSACNILRPGLHSVLNSYLFF